MKKKVTIIEKPRYTKEQELKLQAWALSLHGCGITEKDTAYPQELREYYEWLLPKKDIGDIFVEFDHSKHDSRSRIYTEEEYLPHLKYLEDELKKNKKEMKKIEKAAFDATYKFVDKAFNGPNLKPIPEEDIDKPNWDYGMTDEENYKSINEPYIYNGSSDELITDVSDKTMSGIKGSWKAPEKVNTGKDSITMEIHFDYTHDEDSNIRAEYKDLIAEMHKAKHRNEIIVNEIVEKQDKMHKSVKKHKKHH